MSEKIFNHLPHKLKHLKPGHCCRVEH